MGIPIVRKLPNQPSQEVSFLKTTRREYKGASLIDFDKETVTRILVDELSFNAAEAKLLAGGFSNLHPGLHDSLNDYFEQRIERNIEFGGISTAQIMEKSRCNYINALVTMNAFINDPTLINEYKSIS